MQHRITGYVRCPQGDDGLRREVHIEDILGTLSNLAIPPVGFTVLEDIGRSVRITVFVTTRNKQGGDQDRQQNEYLDIRKSFYFRLQRDGFGQDAVLILAGEQL